MIRFPTLARTFSAGRRLKAIKPFLLADVGEGIKECEVIQWMVEPGARLDEFDPVCELQSDKATVEITSRFAGVVKKLHYEVGDMAQVGSALLDIDCADSPAVATPGPPGTPGPASAAEEVAKMTDAAAADATDAVTNNSAESIEVGSVDVAAAAEPISEPIADKTGSVAASIFKALATPAVRRLCKENDISVQTITGTGKDGRVTKEDVLRFVSSASTSTSPSAAATPASSTSPAAQSPPPLDSSGVTPLKGAAKQMFQTMAAATAIPHFLYTEEIEMDGLIAARRAVNEALGIKLSYMPFMIKALSLALDKFPLVNSRVADAAVPSIETRSAHNISIAMDTPQGLFVPVIKHVESKSILEIDTDLKRLQSLGAAGKLAAGDLQGGTITLSNIGTIGGNYVAPVIVPNQVAIGGVGKVKKVPRFDAAENVVARHVMLTSWSGDHRVLDGVTLARLVDVWRRYLENPVEMAVLLR